MNASVNGRKMNSWAYQSLKKGREDMHSEGLIAKPQVILSIITFFSLSVHCFLPGVHKYGK